MMHQLGFRRAEALHFRSGLVTLKLNYVCITSIILYWCSKQQDFNVSAPASLL